MSSMHSDQALEIAKRLWEEGMDLTDINIVGQNMMSMTCDNFWSKLIRGEEVSIDDIEPESSPGN
jgi:hypothetical protein